MFKLAFSLLETSENSRNKTSKVKWNHLGRWSCQVSSTKSGEMNEVVWGSTMCNAVTGGRHTLENKMRTHQKTGVVAVINVNGSGGSTSSSSSSSCCCCCCCWSWYVTLPYNMHPCTFSHLHSSTHFFPAEGCLAMMSSDFQGCLARRRLTVDFYWV